MIDRRTFIKSCIGTAVGLSIVPNNPKGLRVDDLYKIKQWFDEHEHDDCYIGYDPNKRHWVKFELAPEYENIEGAQEWLDEVNERMNTPEIEGKFREEFNKMLFG